MKTATAPKYDISVDDKHVYRVNGKRKAGVTTILKVIDKPALLYWTAGIVRDLALDNPDLLRSLKDQKDYQAYRAAMDNYMAKKGNAKEIGSEVHAIISHYFKGEFDQIKIAERDEKIQSCYGAFLAWANSHELKMIGVDVMVYNDREDYAGELDWIGLVDGKLTLIDYKTGKGIYPEAKIQVGAYAKAWERTQSWSGASEKTIEQGMVIRIGKEDGAFDEATMTKAEVTRAYKVFQAANVIYGAMKEMSRKGA